MSSITINGKNVNEMQNLSNIKIKSKYYNKKRNDMSDKEINKKIYK